MADPYRSAPHRGVAIDRVLEALERTKQEIEKFGDEIRGALYPRSTQLKEAQENAFRHERELLKQLAELEKNG